jgi:hypothetical protein
MNSLLPSTPLALAAAVSVVDAAPQTQKAGVKYCSEHDLHRDGWLEMYVESMGTFVHACAGHPCAATMGSTYPPVCTSAWAPEWWTASQAKEPPQ